MGSVIVPGKIDLEPVATMAPVAQLQTNLAALRWVWRTRRQLEEQYRQQRSQLLRDLTSQLAVAGSTEPESVPTFNAYLNADRTYDEQIAALDSLELNIDRQLNLLIRDADGDCGEEFRCLLRQGFAQLNAELDADCAAAKRDAELCERRRKKLDSILHGKWHDPGDVIWRSESGIRQYTTRHRTAEDSALGGAGVQQRDVEVQQSVADEGMGHREYVAPTPTVGSESESHVSKRTAKK
jgi:hypothetical protein